jgi:hypothetical protein
MKRGGPFVWLFLVLARVRQLPFERIWTKANNEMLWQSLLHASTNSTIAFLFHALQLVLL